MSPPFPNLTPRRTQRGMWAKHSLPSCGLPLFLVGGQAVFTQKGLLSRASRCYFSFLSLSRCGLSCSQPGQCRSLLQMLLSHAETAGLGLRGEPGTSKSCSGTWRRSCKERGQEKRVFMYFRCKGENKKGRRKARIAVVLKQTCLPYLSTVTTRLQCPCSWPQGLWLLSACWCGPKLGILL